MSDPKTLNPPRSQTDASKARKNAFRGLFHTGMMIGAGLLIGQRIHPVVELIFYVFALVAAAYSVWQGLVAVKANKTNR